MIIAEHDYDWQDALPTCAHDYVLPGVSELLESIYKDGTAKILDVGCGNGHATSHLARLGHSVMGVDASPKGIAIARAAHANVRFEICSVYDDKFLDVVGDQIDCVVALEVVEHLYNPSRLFEQSYRALKGGGYLVLSTPYHGYVKNLALSVVNGWDRHFGVDWEGGHIKFFSKNTLARMACQAGFTRPRFKGVGRLPGLWKSIIMIVQK